MTKEALTLVARQHNSYNKIPCTRPADRGKLPLSVPHPLLGLGLLLVAATCSTWTPAALAQVDQFVQPHVGDSEAAKESKVKAAMLYEFLGYTEWPARSFDGPKAPYRIGVLHAEQVAEELEALTEVHAVGNRPVRVLPLRAAEEMDSLHMLFVGKMAEDQLQAITDEAKAHPILIVTENAQGQVNGSMINLRHINGRMGFEVHLPCTHQRQLKLSARLLSVAASVTEGDP